MCAYGEWIMHTVHDDMLLWVSARTRRRRSVMDLSALGWALCSLIRSAASVVFLWQWGWALILRGRVQDFSWRQLKKNRKETEERWSPKTIGLPHLSQCYVQWYMDDFNWITPTTCYNTSRNEHVRMSSSLLLNASFCPHMQIVILI